MNTILDNNLAALQQQFPGLYDTCKKRLEDISYDLNENNIVVELSQDQEVILGVRKGEHIWYLNSRYNAKLAAEIWWNDISKNNINYKAVVLLCGIGNLNALNAAAAGLGQENKIIVYEPNQEIFMCLIQNVDITHLINDERICIFVKDLNDHFFREYIHVSIDYSLAKHTYAIIAPAYSYLYAEQAAEFMHLCNGALQRIYAESNTYEDLGEEIGDNIISNMWLIGKASSINQAKTYFNEKAADISKVPVIIVSAGPSLDKNIEELKNAKGKSLIIAVDSAIRKLLAHNVIPDMVITVDPHKPMQLFEDERAKNIPVIFCGQSRHDIIFGHTGKAFAYVSDEYSLVSLCMMGKEIDTLETGGSVANTAFSFAEYAGFKRIIFVGQDLAFTDSKKHASNVYEEKAIGEDKEYEYTYVEDINGNPILTFLNFKIYKEWFEGRIQDNKELEVINATEGGANIKGAVNMTLKAAIEEYCTEEFDIDLCEVPDLFTDEELEKYYEFLSNVFERCDKLKEIFDEGINAYGKLGKLLKSGNVNTKEFAEVNKIIEKVNSVNRQEPVMVLVSLYSSKEETEILSDIYDEQDDLKAAICVAEQGGEILEVYKKALDRIYDNIDKLLKYEVSQDIYEVTEYNITFVD